MKIPEKLSERIRKMGQNPEEIYSTRPAKAGIAGNVPVPWMQGFYFNENPPKKEFIIDAASFVPVIALEPKLGELILDMAAAPGMKTALISRLMNNSGTVVACEISRNRILRLKANMKRFGCDICVPVRCDSSRLKWNEKFDKVLLDAPCSGEGMVSKQRKVFKVWSEKRVMRLQKMQKRMIRRGFELLKDGGTFVYSTCTFAPEENEEIVTWLLENYENAIAEKIKIRGLKHSTGISSWNGRKFPEYKKFIRIWPQQNNTNGMFVAKLMKA